MTAAVLCSAMLAGGCVTSGPAEDPAVAISAPPRPTAPAETAEAPPQRSSNAASPRQNESANANADGQHEPKQEPLPFAGETFDRAWQTIRDTHYDLDGVDVDWNDVRGELRPKAVAATSQSELRGVITEMLSRLGQSHFVVLPREVARDVAPPRDAGDDPATSPGERGGRDADRRDEPPTGGRGEVGLRFRLLDDALIVSEVEPNSTAADAGVQPGWALLAIDDEPVAPRIERLLDALEGVEVAAQAAAMGRYMLRGPVGSTVRVTLSDGENEIDRTLTRQRPDIEVFQLGNLPPMPIEFETRELTTDAGHRIGYIRFSVWMLPIARRFHEAVDQFRDADGIIIDLRGNPGGVGGMVMGIGGHFFTEPTSLGSFRNPGAQLEFLANPRFSSATGEAVEPYTGPLAILVDGMSGSTSEIFAGGMQATGRATVFGETSMGAALPAMLTELPNGDMLMHAIADFVSPDGTRLEGRGVIPNKPVTPTREDLRAGRDVVLDAALAWFVEDAVAASSPDNR